MEGRFYLNFTNLPNISLCDEIKIWVYTRNGLGSSGTETFTFQN
jgi:hypothetical protein